MIESMTLFFVTCLASVHEQKSSFSILAARKLGRPLIRRSFAVAIFSGNQTLFFRPLFWNASYTGYSLRFSIVNIIAQTPLFMSYLWVTDSFDCSSGVFSNVIVNFADVLTQRTKLGGIGCRFTNLKQSKFIYAMTIPAIDASWITPFPRGHYKSGDSSTNFTMHKKQTLL